MKENSSWKQAVGTRGGADGRAAAFLSGAMLLAVAMTSPDAVAGPNDEERRPRGGERHRDRDPDRELEARERAEREERRRVERHEAERREDEAAARRQREEQIHRVERALAEARERRKNGRGSDAEVAELERELEKMHAGGRRIRTERREVRSRRGPEFQEEQRELIRRQIELVAEALEEQERRRAAGAADAARVNELRLMRFQLERELIRHSPEEEEHKLERERDLLREQIELLAVEVDRQEARSKFVDQPGASFDLRMRLLGLQRELAALQAPGPEVRVIHREFVEVHSSGDGVDDPFGAEMREQRELHERRVVEQRERHERAVAEARERARQMHEQAERRMRGGNAGGRERRGDGGPDVRVQAAEREAVMQRDRAIENEKRAVEAEQVAVMQRKRAEEAVRIAEAQRAELKAALEAERKRHAAMEKELKALRERVKAMEQKKNSK